MFICRIIWINLTLNHRKKKDSLIVSIYSLMLVVLLILMVQMSRCCDRPF